MTILKTHSRCSLIFFRIAQPSKDVTELYDCLQLLNCCKAMSMLIQVKNDQNIEKTFVGS